MLKNKKTRKENKGVTAIGTVIGCIIALGIIVVISGGLKMIPVLQEFLMTKIIGAGGTTTNKLTDAIECAHWRCKEGCADAKKIVAGCECELSWDKNGDKRICGPDESKIHPIKVKINEETRITNGWWINNACEGICERVSIWKLEKTKCGPREGSKAVNSIMFAKDSKVKCSDKVKLRNSYGQCTVPPGTWYVWGTIPSIFEETVHVSVCDEKPSSIRSCKDECSASGGSDDKCGSGAPGGSKCTGSTCSFWEDIGSIYCDEGNCYCQMSESCDCGGNQECTESGCKAIVEKRFVCCDVSYKRAADYSWLPEYQPCSERVVPGRCNPSTCLGKCTDEGYGAASYANYVCTCSGPSCDTYRSESTCPMGECHWCVGCDGNRVRVEECVEFGAPCDHECVIGECGAECEDSTVCSGTDECKNCRCLTPRCNINCVNNQEDCNDFCAKVGETCVYAETCGVDCFTDCHETTCDRYCVPDDLSEIKNIKCYCT